ncbi:MAG: aminopeptidase [Cyclobacteriaceae bacterium]
MRRRKIWIAIIGTLALVIIWQWDFIRYGLRLAEGQIEVIVNAKPIEDFLAAPDFPDSLKSKLRLAQEVRLFAMEELKLNHSDNYTKLYDQKGKVLIWNVSACEPYKLEPYKWYFPFLGKMPYKGFFDLEEAKLERAQLDELGLDTRIRPVGGWSTLGILNDPILSNMLNRSDGDLAEVIIHELTHATIFVKNEIEFNENLASFIGERGAELFLAQQFGDSSEAYLDYIQSQSDGRRLTEYILLGARTLDSLYSHIENQPDSVRKTLKGKAIDSIVDAMDTVSFYNEKYYNIFRKTSPNNAYFMSFMRYHAQEDTLSTIYNHYDDNLKKMIEALKDEYGK